MPILHPDQSWHALPDLVSTSDAVSLVVTCHYRIPQVVSTGSALPDDVEFCTSVYTTGCPSADMEGGDMWRCSGKVTQHGSLCPPVSQ